MAQVVQNCSGLSILEDILKPSGHGAAGPGWPCVSREVDEKT